MKSGPKALDRLITKFQVPTLMESQAGLVNWLATPMGQYLFHHEMQISSGGIFNVPGYRAAQLGISPAHSLLTGLQQEHKLILAPVFDSNAACVCDYQTLPLPSNTLDVVLLHHALEFSPEPHKLLNEVARVVAAGGHIIIIAFNPFSLFGFAKWAAGSFSTQQVWRHHSLRMARLVDWLQLIGFQIVTADRGGAMKGMRDSQINRDRQLSGWIRRRISAGAFFVIVARKQVVPLTPVRQTRWPPVKVPAFAGLKTVDKDSA
ncbi:MAG: hypothetical protein DRR06_02065 [Gammaproteobacteria bacterium]|nr:MAG: hypothetical protein DRR06_02065 [Gammaproteobacteria bacterium]RLA53934.1 MAG: hypothetical protein DRR42_03415 [Gammaproteobacteria bacterium]